jgi:hypothetical protein
MQEIAAKATLCKCGVAFLESNVLLIAGIRLALRKGTYEGLACRG